MIHLVLFKFSILVHEFLASQQIVAGLSYAQQLVTHLLPEVTLVVIISYVLTVLAIELGQGRSKKTLALESLHALQLGLLFVVTLYVVQFFYVSYEVLFNGYLMTSGFTVALKILTAVSGLFILTSSEQYMKEHQRHLLEYPLVLSMAILFMLLLIGSGHLISAFLSLVGFSLNLYVLILFDAPTAVAREAGIKYFYLSAFSSGLILYGIFIIFLILKTAHFQEIRQLLSIQPELLVAHSSALSLAVLLLLVGLFFKLSAFPGHLWAAEVYEGSPDPITAFFMLPVKVAVLAFVMQLLTVTLESAYVIWQPIIAISALGSLVWGCFAAFTELKTKRFFAYASINQIGFILLGIATGSFDGFQATMTYLLIYAVMNVGLLTVFLHARRADGQSLIYLTDFRSLGSSNWLASWTLSIVLFSMAGIPPLAGFAGKYFLLLHAQEQGLYVLVIVALVTSLVSTYYYLRLVRILFFEKTTAATPVTLSLSNNQWLSLFFVEGFIWFFLPFADILWQILPDAFCNA